MASSGAERKQKKTKQSSRAQNVLRYSKLFTQNADARVPRAFAQVHVLVGAINESIQLLGLRSCHSDQYQ